MWFKFTTSKPLIWRVHNFYNFLWGILSPILHKYHHDSWRCLFWKIQNRFSEFSLANTVVYPTSVSQLFQYGNCKWLVLCHVTLYDFCLCNLYLFLRQYKILLLTLNYTFGEYLTGLGTTTNSLKTLYVLCYAVTKSCRGQISREWAERILNRRGPHGLIWHKSLSKPLELFLVQHEINQMFGFV